MILSTVGLGLGAYALGAGAISSAAMIARGGVRAIGSICHRDVRGATLELLGGMAAPAVSAAHQLAALGCEIVACAVSISAGSAGSDEISLPDGTGSDGGPAIGRRTACATSACG